MSNVDTTQEQHDMLEGLIDSCGLASILEAISAICDEKAEYVRANWQDEKAAKAWDTACGVVGCASCDIPFGL